MASGIARASASFQVDLMEACFPVIPLRSQSFSGISRKSLEEALAETVSENPSRSHTSLYRYKGESSPSNPVVVDSTGSGGYGEGSRYVM